MLVLGSSELSSLGEVSSVSNEAVPEMDPDLEPDSGGGLSDERREDSYCVFLEMGKVATHNPSPEKGMLRWGFLLRRSFRVVPERRRLCSLEERLLSSWSV